MAETKNHLRVRRGWFRSDFYRFGTGWRFEVAPSTNNLHVWWDGHQRVYPPGTWKRIDVTPVRTDSETEAR